MDNTKPSKATPGLMEHMVTATVDRPSKTIHVFLGSAQVHLTPSAAAKLADRLQDSLAIHYREAQCDRICGKAVARLNSGDGD